MEFVNSKGVRWYLHKQQTIIGRNKQEVTTYFFRKVKQEGFCSMPIGYKTKETPNGLPIIKRL